MKTILIQKDKWYHSDYSIYEKNQLIGEYLPDNWKDKTTLNLKNKSFSLMRKSIWKSEKELFLGNIKIGEINRKLFKDQSIVTLLGQGEFIVKKTNIWKSIYTLYSGDRAMGESITKNYKTILNTGDQVDDSLLSALLFVSLQQQQHAWVAFIALIPVFINILN